MGLSQVSSRVQFPLDYSELSKEDQKDFKQTRYGNENLLPHLFHSLCLILCKLHWDSCYSVMINGQTSICLINVNKVNTFSCSESYLLLY